MALPDAPTQEVLPLLGAVPQQDLATTNDAASEGAATKDKGPSPPRVLQKRSTPPTDESNASKHQRLTPSATKLRNAEDHRTQEANPVSPVRPRTGSISSLSSLSSLGSAPPSPPRQASPSLQLLGPSTLANRGSPPAQETPAALLQAAPATAPEESPASLEAVNNVVDAKASSGQRRKRRVLTDDEDSEYDPDANVVDVGSDDESVVVVDESEDDNDNENEKNYNPEPKRKALPLDPLSSDDEVDNLEFDEEAFDLEKFLEDESEEEEEEEMVLVQRGNLDGADDETPQEDEDGNKLVDPAKQAMMEAVRMSADEPRLQRDNWVEARDWLVKLGGKQFDAAPGEDWHTYSVPGWIGPHIKTHQLLWLYWGWHREFSVWKGGMLLDGCGMGKVCLSPAQGLRRACAPPA